MSIPTVVSDHEILHQLYVDLPPTIILLLISAVLLYFSIFALVKTWIWTSRVLILPALLGLWSTAYVAPVRCAAMQAVSNFIVAGATMKLLDIHALTLFSRLPAYTTSPSPSPSLLSFLLLTELRYESFTPNPIRLPPFYTHLHTKPHPLFFTEPTQFLLHTLLLLLLHSLPPYPPLKALTILFTIYILWTSTQLLLRYPTSPPLFGPIYLASGISTFWTETWHNAFTSPCLSLAYTPTLALVSRLRIPRSIARATAVIVAFSLMAVFHMYTLAPLLSAEGTKRVGVFFVANGVGTVGERVVWGKRRGLGRAVATWGFELVVASWVVAEVEVAEGMLRGDWRGLCRGAVGG
ncbi:hypothetical protein P154DRAFT_496914 [Amniculicola lignicola CBS 123094]|uniref:Wax synthase domain-containing protein n=1 Tax=Amniculicola lignicola CBS 123094 TaxID=1392246 RepID=A0A6A5WBG9_9PLEO|nr:hypothetical protein P154DRAFT_496914 [Amniculicola lignicola CBS 123094]